MSEVKVITATSTPKKKRRKPHPNTRIMVDDAVKELNKCSYRAIKQFIVTKYLVDLRYILNRIKSYIRESVANGKFIQMTGHGLNGSFRLSAAAKRNPKKFIIRTRKLLKRKPKNKVNIKSPTFLMEPIIHRRTSITMSKILIKRRNTRKIDSTTSPMSRNQSSTIVANDTNNNDLPSTSSVAIGRVPWNRRDCCKLSHMC